MTTLIEDAAALLGVLGFGGILGAYFQLVFQHRKEVKEQEHELKHRRYGAIIILMLTQLDPKTGLPHLRNIRPDLANLKDIVKEIDVELWNSFLFASDDVIRSIADFVRSPTYSSYVKAAVSMRRDLWGKKTSVDEHVLSILEKVSESGSSNA